MENIVKHLLNCIEQENGVTDGGPGSGRKPGSKNGQHKMTFTPQEKQGIVSRINAQHPNPNSRLHRQNPKELQERLGLLEHNAREAQSRLEWMIDKHDQRAREAERWGEKQPKTGFTREELAGRRDKWKNERALATKLAEGLDKKPSDIDKVPATNDIASWLIDNVNNEKVTDGGPGSGRKKGSVNRAQRKDQANRIVSKAIQVEEGQDKQYAKKAQGIKEKYAMQPATLSTFNQREDELSANATKFRGTLRNTSSAIRQAKRGFRGTKLTPIVAVDSKNAKDDQDGKRAVLTNWSKRKETPSCEANQFKGTIGNTKEALEETKKGFKGKGVKPITKSTKNIVNDNLITKGLKKLWNFVTETVQDGGPGSGNFEHEGRKGIVGGSAVVGNKQNAKLLTATEKQQIAAVLDAVTTVLNREKAYFKNDKRWVDVTSFDEALEAVRHAVRNKDVTITRNRGYTALKLRIGLEDKMVMVKYDQGVRTKKWRAKTNLEKIGDIVATKRKAVGDAMTPNVAQLLSEALGCDTTASDGGPGSGRKPCSKNKHSDGINYVGKHGGQKMTYTSTEKESINGKRWGMKVPELAHSQAKWHDEQAKSNNATAEKFKKYGKQYRDVFGAESKVDANAEKDFRELAEQHANNANAWKKQAKSFDSKKQIKNCINEMPITSNIVGWLLNNVINGNVEDGGPGSGNYGHKGRPGERGGSGKGGGSRNVAKTYAKEHSHKHQLAQYRKEYGNIVDHHRDDLNTIMQDGYKLPQGWSADEAVAAASLIDIMMSSQDLQNAYESGRNQDYEDARDSLDYELPKIAKACGIKTPVEIVGYDEDWEEQEDDEGWRWDRELVGVKVRIGNHITDMWLNHVTDGDYYTYPSAENDSSLSTTLPRWLGKWKTTK